MKLHRMRSQRQQQQLSWRRAVVQKWLNIATSNSDYSADSDSCSGSGSDSEQEDSPKVSRFKNGKLDEVKFDAKEFNDGPRESRFKNEKLEVKLEANEALPRLRRQNSETSRAHYINSKEIRICAATWNVGGITPDDPNLDDWLDIDVPADIYVIGFQEIIPLNAGNIFGAEDTGPVTKWENVIRETLGRVPPKTTFKSYSDPPSPSRFQPIEENLDVEDEVALESDSDIEGGIYPMNDETCSFYEIKDGVVGGTDFASTDPSFSEEFEKAEEKETKQSSPLRRLERLQCLKIDDESEENSDEPTPQYTKILSETLSGTEKIGLSWPEPPLDVLGQHILDKPNSFGSAKSFKTFKSFWSYNSFKSINETTTRSDLKSLVEIDLESLINRKRRPAYVRIVSKQMVGIFITIWVRRSLRKYIQNVSVSAVGVGVMGYIGNKGAISVSMSVHQTVFCFICTHLTAGEKEADAAKRNADVLEIHRRTRFNLHSAMGLPTRIYDHERIIWFGDLNYRINLPYDRARKLISEKDWTKLLEQDQLMKEFKKGRAFDGWSEGTVSFAPTYKYELNSDTYFGEDPKLGRRTPAWCDRVLSFGAGMRLVDYRRSEIKILDHRPVTASYVVEVEVFSHKKLQRALTFTTAQVEEENLTTDVELNTRLSLPVLEEDESYWEH